MNILPIHLKIQQLQHSEDDIFSNESSIKDQRNHVLKSSNKKSNNLKCRLAFLSLFTLPCLGIVYQLCKTSTFSPFNPSLSVNNSTGYNFNKIETNKTISDIFHWNKFCFEHEKHNDFKNYTTLNLKMLEHKIINQGASTLDGDIFQLPIQTPDKKNDNVNPPSLCKIEIRPYIVTFNDACSREERLAAYEKKAILTKEFERKIEEDTYKYAEEKSREAQVEIDRLIVERNEVHVHG